MPRCGPAAPGAEQAVNVFIVSAMFPPIRTGTSFYTRNLAAALEERGHRVAVAALEHGQDEPDRYPFLVYRLPALRVPLPGFFNHFSSRHSFRRIFCGFPASRATSKRT